MPKFDVLPIHLIRDPCGVAYSQLKKGEPWLPRVRQYTIGTMRARRALRDTAHVNVHYTELVAETERALRPIMEAIGLEFDPDQVNRANRERHNCGGNRMRFSTDSTIRPEVSWRSGLSLAQKLRIRMMTMPLHLPESVYNRVEALYRGRGWRGVFAKAKADWDRARKRRRQRRKPSASRHDKSPRTCR